MIYSQSILLLCVLSAAHVVGSIHLPLQMVKSKHRFHKRDVIPLINDIDLSELAVKVQVGSPPQEFLLLFDTGSADTWVPSTRCLPSHGCPHFLHRYNSTASSTFTPLNDTLRISYGIGSAQGHYFQDTISFVGNDELAIPSQTLATVDKAVGPISNQDQHPDSDHVLIDGILGAGLPHGTVRFIQNKGDKYDPFPVALYKAGLISNPVFSVSMMNIQQGQLTLGDVDHEVATTAQFFYTELAHPGHRWAINVLGLQFHNQIHPGASRDFKFNVDTPFGVDTGSNFMYLPSRLANDLAIAITSGEPNQFSVDPSTGALTVNCAYQSSPNSVKIFLKSSEDGETFNLSLSIAQLIERRESDGQCLFLFIPSDDKFIIGNLILRQFVTVFDFGSQPRIGFAPSRFAAVAASNAIQQGEQ